MTVAEACSILESQRHLTTEDRQALAAKFRSLYGVIEMHPVDNWPSLEETRLARGKRIWEAEGRP